MYLASRFIATMGLVLAGLGGIDSTGSAGTQEQLKATKSARGGILATADGHGFEVFFFPTGARVFPLGGAGGPVDATHLSGSVTFYHPDAPAKPWFSRPLHVEPVAAGQVPSSLDLNIGLNKVPQKGVVVVVEVLGLGAHAGSPAVFKVPFQFVAAAAPQPTAPQGNVASGARYVYGPGPYGIVYYAIPGPETPPQPAPATPGAYAPRSVLGVDRSMSDHAVGPMHRDWATGRSSPLSRPWLRPRD